MVIFLLVSLQMTAALRPLIVPGTADHLLPTAKKFFVTHWFDCLDGRAGEAGAAIRLPGASTAKAFAR